MMQNIYFPANSQEFMDAVIKYAQFDPIQTSLLDEWMYNLPEMDSFNANFEACGYEFLFMITNIGSAKWICLINVIMAIISFIVYKQKCKCKNELHVFYWNGLIRLFMSVYQDIALLSILNLDTLEWKGDSSSEDYSYILSIISIVLVCFLPLVFLVVLYRKIAVWNEPQFQNNFGALLGDANIANQRYERWTFFVIPLAFFVRKIIYVISVIKLQDFVFAQIALQIFFSMGMIIFIQQFKILQPWYANHIETFNEACALLLLYIAISFTDLN